MGKLVLVLDADRTQCRQVCTILDERQYQPVAVHSLTDLEQLLGASACRTVIIDIDSVPVDNRLFRVLKQQNPGISFLCLSGSRFHPELQEALGNHIYACLNKPVDPDELFYLLKSIYHSSGRPD